jgi:hypothetical protein
MRNAGGIVLGGLWILLLLAYSAPFRRPGLVSGDFAISVRGPAPAWTPVAVLVFVLMLPALVLGAVTWWWIAR